MTNACTHTRKIENSKLSIVGNKIQSNKDGVELTLTKNQATLLGCLTKGIHENKTLASIIWNDGNDKCKKNNFNQLIYQLRRSLEKKGFPDDIIITIPRYGYCLNKNYFRNKNNIEDYKTDFLIAY